MINHETNHENSELSNENKSDRLVWPMDEKKKEKKFWIFVIKLFVRKFLWKKSKGRQEQRD